MFINFKSSLLLLLRMKAARQRRIISLFSEAKKLYEHMRIWDWLQHRSRITTKKTVCICWVFVGKMKMMMKKRHAYLAIHNFQLPLQLKENVYILSLSSLLTSWLKFHMKPEGCLNNISFKFNLNRLRNNAKNYDLSAGDQWNISFFLYENAMMKFNSAVEYFYPGGKKYHIHNTTMHSYL